MSAPKGPKKYSTDDLRSFYFSKSTNIGNYSKQAGATNTSTASVASPAAAPPQDQSSIQRSVTPSEVDVSVASVKALPTPVPSAATPSPANPGSSAMDTTATIAAKPSTPAVGSAVAAARTSKPSASSVNTSIVGHSAESVSPTYIQFLRQQQDLVKSHCSIDDVLQQFLAVAAEQRSGHKAGVTTADGILNEAESSTEWNWKSKFNREQLVRDAGMTVGFESLRYADDLPSITDLQHQHQQLVKLRQAHCTGTDDKKTEFNLTLENGARRIDRLMKEYSMSQLDSGDVTRLADNLVVQLDHVLGQQPLPLVLQEVNDVLAVVSEKQRECMAIRDQALDDGDMAIAERETLRLVDLSEELCNTQVEKIQLLIRAQEENTVSSTVRENYANKATDNSQQLEDSSGQLKARCEADLARLYSLKEQVDTAEHEMINKVNNDRANSDAKLDSIAQRQHEAWEQIDALVKQIRQLEAERHKEVKTRIEDKVKDETRRNEYRMFCDVSNEHAANLDRTVKNCDTQIHCTKLMAEYLQSGFFTIQKHLTHRRSEIDETLLDAQRTHLEVFRSLLFTLGDLEYKKERKIDEVGNAIQAAHVQQELCNDSLNPNAKKFSDQKKDLLKQRDELEMELRDVRDRQVQGLEQYKPTEDALNVAEVQHTHPMSDLEERRLNTRAKMVEYKAMSLGHVSSAPIKSEVESLRKSLNESRRLISQSAANAKSKGQISGISSVNTTVQ